MIIRVETSQKLRKNDCKQRRNNEEMGGIISSKKEPEKTLPPNARIVSDKESTRRRKNEPVVERESKRIKEKMEPLPPPSIQVDIPPLTDQPPRPAGVSPRNIQKPITPTVSVKGFAFPPNTQPKDYFKTVHSAVRWQKPNIAEILDHPDTVDCLDEKTGNLPILTLLIRSLILYMPYHIHSVVLTWFTLSCRLGNLPIHIAAQNGYIEIVRWTSPVPSMQSIKKVSYSPSHHHHHKLHHPIHPPIHHNTSRQFCDARGDSVQLSPPLNHL